jgi:hypothetical protein
MNISNALGFRNVIQMMIQMMVQMMIQMMGQMMGQQVLTGDGFGVLAQLMPPNPALGPPPEPGLIRP